MFGLGHAPELILVLVIALIVLGPGKIPEVAQMLGKGIRELRQASADLQKTFDVNELMNPAQPPAPPSPVEPPVAAAAVTETIAPPVMPESKPKRTRKRSPGSSENGAQPAIGNEDVAAAAGVADEPAAKPRARRRPSKTDPEPVST